MRQLEFIRNLIREKIDEELLRKEEIGRMVLAEQTLKEIWDNDEDEQLWNTYLKSP